MRTIIISVILAAVSLTVSAQNHKSLNEIYSKYSSSGDVSAVYISPAMFNMIKQIPEVGGTDISPAVSSLDGMFVIEIEDNPEKAGNLAADVRKYVSSGKYELLMEAVDSEETVRIYVNYDSDGNIREFVLLNTEPGSAAYICFVGKMDKDVITQLMQQ